MHDQSARLLGFPIDRRIALVRRTAEKLSALNGEAANGYWRETARGLLQDLVRQGRDMESARGEVLRFFEAVQGELRKHLVEGRSLVTA
ncbi:DUF6074 family protein [Mesorhizobium sp. LHD-90]|uniref:DUF6074 family protein n=1 Tax=Mesorhizobium sp. LHD-90 TaxID=3071414 RepID=UPI0027E0E510|nr:DUF6074 family protein [Mesorhizobium sp. LHD-90]MDQ6436703.1 DUF6074 family protein [Mesorhizobium sp. LHD-90]